MTWSGGAQCVWLEIQGFCKICFLPGRGSRCSSATWSSTSTMTPWRSRPSRLRVVPSPTALACVPPLPDRPERGVPHRLAPPHGAWRPRSRDPVDRPAPALDHAGGYNGAAPRGPEDGDDGASAALPTEWHALRRARSSLKSCCVSSSLRMPCVTGLASHSQSDAAPILPLWRFMHAQVVARQCGDAPPRAWLRSMSRVDRGLQRAATGSKAVCGQWAKCTERTDLFRRRRRPAWTRPVLRETLHAGRRSAVPAPMRLHRHALHVPDESIDYLPHRRHLVRQLW